MNSPDLMPALLKMFSALSLVVGIAFITLWAFRKLMNGRVRSRSDAKAIEIVSSKYLGSKHSIVLVNVVGHILVVGISPSGMSTLAQLDDEDSHDRLAAMDGQRGEGIPFAACLSHLASRFYSAGESGERQRDHHA